MRAMPSLLLALSVALCATAMSGERGVRIIQSGPHSFRVPLPDLGGAAMTPLGHSNDGFEYQGRLAGAAVNATAEVEKKSISYQDFADLKADALQRPALDATFDARRMRLAKPDVVEETLNDMIVGYDARANSPARPDRRAFSPVRVCFGHLYLYGRHLVLTLVADRDTKGALENAMRNWVRAVLRENAQGVYQNPHVTLPIPGAADAGIEIPFPAGFERYANAGREVGAPALRFTDADARRSGRAAVASLIMTGKPVSAADFRRMADSPAFNDTFLKQPQGARGPRDNDVIKFSYADDKRSIITNTAVCLLKGRPVRFDIVVPYNDRPSRDWAEKTLDDWARSAVTINRPGYVRPGAFNPYHPGPQIPPRPQPAPGKR